MPRAIRLLFRAPNLQGTLLHFWHKLQGLSRGQRTVGYMDHGAADQSHWNTIQQSKGGDVKTPKPLPSVGHYSGHQHLHDTIICWRTAMQNLCHNNKNTFPRWVCTQQISGSTKPYFMVPERGIKDELNTNNILDLHFSAWHCQQRRGTYYMDLIRTLIQQNMTHEAPCPCAGFRYAYGKLFCTPILETSLHIICLCVMWCCMKFSYATLINLLQILSTFRSKVARKNAHWLILKCK